MNKQEAIEEIEDSLMFEISGNLGISVNRNDVINIISQIDEPQKVVVPKEVAEWLRKYRQDHTLLKVLNAAENERVIPSAVNDWILDNQRDFVVAWYDGFEIEQLFTVDIPNPVLTDNSDSVTVLMKIDSGVVLTDVVNYIGRKQETVYQLTESEIKQDFEWAWQFAEEVE
ncbi:TPA: DUF1642 domain-containing protein [Streptococcus suis]